MFPSPKPEAPRLSMSSRKNVSSAKIGLVNTCRRYLGVGERGRQKEAVGWLLVWDIAGVRTASLTSGQRWPWFARRHRGAGLCPGGCRAWLASLGYGRPPRSPAACPPVPQQYKHAVSEWRSQSVCRNGTACSIWVTRVYYVYGWLLTVIPI